MLPKIDHWTGNLADLTLEQAQNELISKIIPSAASPSTTTASTNHNINHKTEGNTTIEVDEGVEQTKSSTMQYQTI